MNLIKNDPYVASIDCAKMALIRQVFDKYPIQDKVYLFETIHGHIATLNFKAGRFLPHQENTPARLDNEELQFWIQLAPKLRWFEVGHGIIEIAF